MTSITGAVLVSGGFLISIFANSVLFLYITMGVIVGERQTFSPPGPPYKNFRIQHHHLLSIILETLAGGVCETVA